MLAATSFPPGLLPARWAQAWPLTPFYLALLLTGLVELARARGGHGRPHVAAALIALATDVNAAPAARHEAFGELVVLFHPPLSVSSGGSPGSIVFCGRTIWS